MIRSSGWVTRIMSVRWVPLIALLGLSSAIAVAPAGATAGSESRRGAEEPLVSYFFVGSLDPRPFWITPGPDGNLWFTDTSADKIGRITPAGVVTEFDIGEGKEPYAIVAGADGNLWFTERQNDKVGAVDTDGNLVHEYFIPGIDPRPAGIAAAPNGDIWFTTMGTGENITNSVGRITPSGAVIQYQLYPCACFPVGITTGPDGNLWATEELGVYEGESPGTVDRITPNGASITRFPVPHQPLTPGHLPAFVAPGPDGNVWFTEFAADLHRIGKITPAGQITEYTLPGTFTNSVGITTGSDERMWVTQGDAGRVVVVDPDGTIVATIPTHHQPSGITIGPDGNMWFAAALDGEIGRIQTARPGYGYVLEIASGFVPGVRTVPLDTTVEWVLEAPGVHRVRDASGLGLYDSGPKPPVSFHYFTFAAAGTYPYADRRAGERGAIAVPVVAPTTGQLGVPFSVRWASAAPRAGLVFDVQVRRPRSGAWETWQSGVRQTDAAYTPRAVGSYEFRARLREVIGNGTTLWSPPQEVTIEAGVRGAKPAFPRPPS